jgi:hypothetical protein
MCFGHNRNAEYTFPPHSSTRSDANRHFCIDCVYGSIAFMRSSLEYITDTLLSLLEAKILSAVPSP